MDDVIQDISVSKTLIYHLIHYIYPYIVPYLDKSKIEYEKISIPKEMVNEIKRIIETDKRLGFVSIQEFVKEAVRRNIVFYGDVNTDKSSK